MIFVSFDYTNTDIVYPFPTANAGRHMANMPDFKE